MTAPGDSPGSRPVLDVEGTSSERRPAVHVARNLVLVIPILALALVAATTIAQTPVRSLSTDVEPSESADLESVARAVDDEVDNDDGDEAGSDGSADDGAQIDAEPEAGQQPTATDRATTPIVVVPPAPSAARLDTGTVQRIVDTRGTEASDPSAVPLPGPGASVRAMVLSVSLIGSERAGTVTIEGSYGSIDAVTVGGPGAATSNPFLVVPGSEPSTVVNPTGGDLVIDLVATFVTAGPSSAGRLLAVDPVRLATLVTATDGRDALVNITDVSDVTDPRGADGADPAVAGVPAAALVLITADVGDDGGRVALGPAPGQLDQMMMWGPPSTPNRQRSGVALVTPGPDGGIALRYDGGSVLDVDLIAIVTGDDAAVSNEGLFVPATTVARFDRVFGPGTTVLEPAAPASASAIVNVRAEPGGAVVPQPAELATDLTVASGRTIGTVLPVGPGPGGGPGIVVTSEVELEARLQPIGYLLAGTP